ATFAAHSLFTPKAIVCEIIAAKVLPSSSLIACALMYLLDLKIDSLGLIAVPKILAVTLFFLLIIKATFFAKSFYLLII
ncbi:hypothetical protein, partial [Aliarcobacter cryaerophilus]|uniref:hypothetical protein n=1 Tax=Aliarcobacter cryaerophilus TaxID=28198 RepID=UPI003BAC64E9